MQRFGGLLLMLSSLAVVGGYLALPESQDDAADLAEVTRISVAPYHSDRTAGSSLRTFAPASPAFRDVVESDSRTSAPARQQPVQPWTTVVSAEPSRTAILRSAEPGDARTRFELARDLQRELKRAGCYGGDITGVWSPSTKRAMSAFMDRANATLPINAPDYILLSLVENHGDISCATACPSGQAMSASGRCVPDVVAAQTSKRVKSPDQRRIAEARARAEPERLPWLDRDGKSIVAQAAPRTPPPGMMSIGGPGFGAPPTARLSQNVVVIPEGGTLGGATNDMAGDKVAAVAPAEGVDPDSTATEFEAAAPARIERPRRIKRAPREWRDERPPRRYGRTGKTRRGDPKPGTMRYNVAQALGGIY